MGSLPPVNIFSISIVKLGYKLQNYLLFSRFRRPFLSGHPSSLWTSHTTMSSVPPSPIETTCNGYQVTLLLSHHWWDRCTFINHWNCFHHRGFTTPGMIPISESMNYWKKWLSFVANFMCSQLLNRYWSLEQISMIRIKKGTVISYRHKHKLIPIRSTFNVCETIFFLLEYVLKWIF